LWTDAANGNPATLAGYRVVTCDALTQSQVLNGFPILFGNWRCAYLLADRTSMQITLELYSTPGQTRFYARKRVGGTVKNNDAVQALKIAVS
jgi:HK97 family phage major capsid protein